MMNILSEEIIVGCLLGTAIADATGLALENISKQRQLKLFPHFDGPCFWFGKGMTSDDTEHTCLIAQSLIVSNGDEVRFRKDFAKRLRFWALGLPAGTGSATLKASIKLWFGFRKGVFSAGNGPAMRSAIIGVCYGHNPEKLKALTRISTELTHTDPKAYFGALSVALAAFLASQIDSITPQIYSQKLKELLSLEADTEEFLNLIQQTMESVENKEPLETFANTLYLDQGVSGYVYHTIPVVLHCWLSSSDDYKSSIMQIIRLGGDADTTAAILGGIIGAKVHKEGLPQEWLNRLMEWPRSVHWIEALGKKLTIVLLENQPQKALSLPILGLFLRNIFFFIVVLLHGFRRLFPPY